MTPNPRWLLPALLFVLAAPRPKDEIVFAVAAQTTLVRELKNDYSMTLDSMALTLNGEEFPHDFLGEIEIEIQHEEHYTVTDVFESVAAGRPTRLVRSFDELGGKEEARFKSNETSENNDSDYESALEGKRVVFSWNEGKSEFEAAYDKSVEGDAALLEPLVEDMDLRRFLPAGAVSEGDTWQVEPAAFTCVLDPGGDLALEDPDDEDKDDGTEDEQLRENLAGTITATYGGTRDADGVRVAVIALTIDTNTHAESTKPAEDGATQTDGTNAAFRLEGELLWDLEHGHALSLELSGENEFKMEQALKGESEGEQVEQTQTMVFSGASHYTMRFERK